MYRTTKRAIILATLLSITCFAESSFAYKVSAHRIVTDVALNKSQNYSRFINDFSINDTQAVIDGSEWEDGEDFLDMRWFNHYYDPVNQKGLHISGISYGRISKDWAYDGGSGRYGYSYLNNYSWLKAREYMHNALINIDHTERSKYFQLMFRSLGQVSHLIQDLAQPSHVRNDPHASHGEVPVIPYVLNPSRFEDWAQDNGGVVSGYAASASSARNYPLFDNYFNTIASFTNANFFSDDTIFKNYASPSTEQTDLNNYTFIDVLAEVVDEDGETSRTIYITKTGGVRTGYKVAHAGYFAVELSAIGFNTAPLQFEIDDRVAQENAQILIPLAVEYSAGIINYFFRGSIDMEKDPDDSTKYVIKNLSNESIEGAFTLYYDDTDDNRRLVASWNLSINAGDESNPVEFTEPTDAKEKGRYILVFSGTLGSEVGAVVGKVVTIEKEKEELILYAVGSQYKTYNLKTKEIKSYNGPLVGATGEVAWREDGKEYLINNGYMTGVGWRGNVAITAMVNYYQGIYRLYLDEKFPNGTTKSYTFDLPYGSPYYKPQISRDGEQITFGAYYSYYGILPFTYYLFHLDTVGKNFSFEESGIYKYEGGIYSGGRLIGSYYIGNYPYLMGYYGNTLNTLYYNHYYKYTSQRLDSCTVVSVSERASTYEKLGDTQSNQVYTRVSGCGNPSSSSTVASSTDIYALNYRVLKDGKEIIPYMFSEESYSSSSGGNQRTYSVTPYLYIGGTVIGGESLKYNGMMHWNKKSLINLNGRKDKAVVGIWANAWYYKQDSTEMDIGRVNLVYYVSDKEVRNLTAENPDFKNAEFFTFVEE